MTRQPGAVEAHMAFGNFPATRGDAPRAEAALRRAAELAPVGSPARLRLAEFLGQTGRAEEGKRVLAEITRKASDYLPVWRRIAEQAFAARQWEESQRALELLLKKSPSDLDGHFLRGRLQLAKGESTEAVLLLAELDIQAGALQPAIDALEALVARQPRAVPAWVLLGSAYLARGDGARGVEAYRKVMALAPKDPRGPHLVGLALRAQGKAAEARRSFEAALALRPGYVEPLAQLAAMALADRQPDAALARLRQQLAVEPRSAPMHALNPRFAPAANNLA